MYYFVYKITNCINNHYYIGVHQTSDINDGYMGSGTRLHNAYKKYGIENFKRDIIMFFDKPTDMYDLERFLITPKEVHDDNCYNVKVGGYGGWDYAIKQRTKETFSKISKTRIEKGYKSPMLGKHHTEETKNKLRKPKSDDVKQKMSESAKKRGLKPMLGKHHTEETKQKMRETRLKNGTSEKQRNSVIEANKRRVKKNKIKL